MKVLTISISSVSPLRKKSIDVVEKRLLLIMGFPLSFNKILKLINKLFNVFLSPLVDIFFHIGCLNHCSSSIAWPTRRWTFCAASRPRWSEKIIQLICWLWSRSISDSNGMQALVWSGDVVMVCIVSNWRDIVGHCTDHLCHSLSVRTSIDCYDFDTWGFGDLKRF